MIWNNFQKNETNFAEYTSGLLEIFSSLYALFMVDHTDFNLSKNVDTFARELYNINAIEFLRRF